MSLVLAYCETLSCPAREIEVTVKGIHTIGGLRFVCPSCARPVVAHLETNEETDRRVEREARSSVLQQLYIARERKAGRDTFCIPVGVFLDDRLPVAEDLP